MTKIVWLPNEPIIHTLNLWRQILPIVELYLKKSVETRSLTDTVFVWSSIAISYSS